MTMMSRLEIITTSIRPSTMSMMASSSRLKVPATRCCSSIMKCTLGGHALGDRDQERDQLAGFPADGLIGAAMLDVGLQRGVEHQHARAFHERALGQQHAAH